MNQIKSRTESDTKSFPKSANGSEILRSFFPAPNNRDQLQKWIFNDTN